MFLYARQYVLIPLLQFALALAFVGGFCSSLIFGIANIDADFPSHLVWETRQSCDCGERITETGPIVVLDQSVIIPASEEIWSPALVTYGAYSEKDNHFVQETDSITWKDPAPPEHLQTWTVILARSHLPSDRYHS